MHSVDQQLPRAQTDPAGQESHVPSVYCCPDCRAPLAGLHCVPCARTFEQSRGFPVLLPSDPRFQSAREILEVYDDIYSRHANVWENQGRSRDLVRFVADLVQEPPARRVLEVGCGEGLLLAAIAAPDKYGTDLSAHALAQTQQRTRATLCVALAERLPFPDGYFDAVASVGVMEHFLDDRAACSEIFRVLAPGGRYATLLHVHLSAWQSLRQKVSEYLFPRPRPIALARWIGAKLFKPIHQPVQNAYTEASARTRLIEAGFEVATTIHRGNTPSAPLIGPHVIVLVCRRPAT